MSFKYLGAQIGILLIVAALLTGATVITFAYVVFSDMGELGGMYDIYRYYAPLTFYIDHCIHSGELPLWNPLTYCGLPNTGNPQSFLFYPPHLLRALLTVNPTPESSNTSLAIMMGLHFIFMAFCTYLLGRAHGLRFAGALTAAIAFAFSALMVRRMCEYHLITTIAWLPLLLLLIKNCIDSVDFFTKLGLAVCAGLVLGLSILGGFLQIVNLMGLVAGVYALFYFLLNTDWKERYPTWGAWLKPWLHNGVAMAALLIIACCLAAVLLIPAWELAGHTLRTTGEPANKYSNLWAWSPLDFYQRMVVYAGIKYEAETIRNAGIAALILAVLGLAHPKRRDVCLFAGLYLLLFECSFGPPLPLGALLEKLTPFSLSAYSRAYDFAMLPLGLLAGYGVDAVCQPMPNRGHSYARALVILVLGYIFLAPLSVWLNEITFITVNDLVRTIPMAAIAVMLVAGTVHLVKPAHVVAGLLLAVLVFSETVAWNQSYVPYMARRKVRDMTEIKREDVAIPTTNFRETDPICNRFLYSLRFAMNGVDPLHISKVRDVVSGPPRDRHPFRGVQNWEPTRENLRGNMIFKRSFWLAREYAVAPLPGKRSYFPASTTVFLDQEIDAPVPKVNEQDLRRSAVSEDVIETVITEPPALFAPVPGGQKRSMTFTITLPEKLPDMPAGSAGAVHSTLMFWYTSNANAQVDTWIEQPETDRSEHGIRHNTRATGGREVGAEVPLPDFPVMRIKFTVENKGPGEFQFARVLLRTDRADEDGLIQILARNANTVDLQIGPLAEYRVLTFLDADYPGWTAYVNGVEAPILRANDEFKAIVLPPGVHRVYFAFNHVLTWQSLGISLATFGVALVLLILCWLLRLPGVSPNDRDKFRLEVEFTAERKPLPPRIQRT